MESKIGNFKFNLKFLDLDPETGIKEDSKDGLLQTLTPEKSSPPEPQPKIKSSFIIHTHLETTSSETEPVPPKRSEFTSFEVSGTKRTLRTFLKENTESSEDTNLPNPAGDEEPGIHHDPDTAADDFSNVGVDTTVDIRPRASGNEGGRCAENEAGYCGPTAGHR